MKPKLWPFLTLLVVMSMLILIGCAPASPEAPKEAPAVATEAPATEAVATEAPATEAPVAEATEAPAEPAAGEPVKVTIFVGFGTGTKAKQMEVHEQLAEEFNSTHSDIQIEFLHVPGEEHIAKFSTMLAADSAPDLIMPTGVKGVAEFYEEWLDITPYLERDNYDMSDFYEGALRLHRYPNKVVGLPIGVYPSVIYYNEDLFDAAGLDYPPHEFGAPYAGGDPWTYDKLVEVAKELSLDADGNSASSPDFDPENMVQWGWNGWEWTSFRAFPAKFGGSNLGVTEDLKTAENNAQAWVEAMQWNTDTIWTWHIRANMDQADAAYWGGSASDPMGSGMLGMWETFSWMSWAWWDWSDLFNWDVAAIPTGPHGDLVAPINGDTFAIPKSAHHPDEAWEVAKWLLEPEILARLAQNYGCIPARASLANEWISGAQEDFPDVDFQVFIDSIEYADYPQHEQWIPNFAKIDDAQERTLETMVTGENTNVQELMDNLNAEVQGYLDEYWASQ